MIKKMIIILINLFLFACIDIITEEEFYESIHLEKSGWVEFYENNVGENIELNQNFTIQVWFSSQELLDLEAPCIANINNELWDLAVFRNPNVNNLLMIYLNQELASEIEITEVDFDNKNNFYLLSIVVENTSISIYLNEALIFQESVESNQNQKLIVGANKYENSISNLWYGYVDEIRIWNEALHDSVITFHNQYKYKISSSYDDNYLESLIGLWDFRLNTEGESPTNIFQEINEYNTYSIIYTFGNTTNEFSTNGR